jgi:hypothetical protein
MAAMDVRGCVSGFRDNDNNDYTATYKIGPGDTNGPVIQMAQSH